MNLCACGCGVLVKKGVYARGHQWKKKPVVEEAKPVLSPVDNIPQPPPPHPLPFDHQVWHVAAEPVDVDMRAPWRLFRCVGCNRPTWGHSPKTDLCEECEWNLVDELSQSRVNQQNRTRTPWDPFTG